MDEKMPLVTIVTSTYKHEKYLRKTIDSVLNQDYPNIEYIVINDGSPDGTEEILKSYGNQFYWETQENGGEVPALNKAIKMAKGDLIGKISSDDYLYPTCISEVVAQFLRDPELVVVYPDFDLVDEKGSFVQRIEKPDFDDVRAVRDHLCLPGPGALFRKRIFKELRGFFVDFRILFDMDFWWRASLLGKIIRLPKSLSAFRIHSTSQSQGGSRMAEETVKCVHRFYSIPELPARFKKSRLVAFSNAYYAAAMQAATGKHMNLCRRYLLHSFLYFPHNYLKPENEGKIKAFISIILPGYIGNFFLRVARIVKKLYALLKKKLF